MDVRCDKCATEYEFDDNRVGPRGVTVKCTNCGHVFKVRRPGAGIPGATTSIGAGPQGREWLVRKPDAQMIAFRELTTLQKWIVEGRISRDDEISKNGETWKRLGNIMELEPFFSVYEKAQTLNSLIEQQPALELRGSELLSAANPVEGSPPSGAQYPIPSRSQIVQADPVPSQRPALAPASQDLAPPPLPSSSPSAAALASPAADRGASTFDTGLAGPAALEQRAVEPAAPPASFASATLDFPSSSPSDQIEADPVETFQRGQRRQRGLLAAVALALGIGASAAVAMYGPPDNPLRALAVQYGLLEGPAPDDGAGPRIEAARQAAELDSEAALTRALAELDAAAERRPEDSEIAADRALYASLLAMRHARLAAALDAEAKAARAADAAGGPPPDALEKEATRHRTAEETRLREAAHAVEAAERVAPDAFATLRARAAVAVAAQGDDEARRVSTAIEAAEAAQRTDPWLVYLEAVRTDASTNQGRAEALALTKRALTARPTLQRARVLQARLHLEGGALPEAKAAAERVLKAAGEHAEAKRVLDAAVRAEEKAKAEAEALAKMAQAEAEEKKADPEPKKGFDDWMRLGDRLRRRDRTTGALNAYGRAAELNPRSAEVHVGKGWCLLDLERPRPALVSFDRAIKVNDRYAEAYYGRGEALRRIGDKTEAVAAYRAYLSRAPRGAERRVAERRVAELSGAEGDAE